MEPSLLEQVARDVVRTFQANWVYLVLSITFASAIQVFVGTDRLARWLRARTPLAVIGAVALGALTPFCSCGTTAVVLGALASSVPWAPVVAFMVSSPLTSPGEYVLSVGLFGSAFATTYFVAALALGLGSGWVTHHLERAGWLRGQHRIAAAATCGDVAAPPAGSSCSAGYATAERPPLAAGAPVPLPVAGTLVLDRPEVVSCCDAGAPGGVEPPRNGIPTGASRGRTREFTAALLLNGRRLAFFFFGFTALGYLLIRLIPTEALTASLGDDSPFAVPLAALLGIPVYVNSDGSLPLVASLMDGGMGAGAAMAFLITGAGTSIGAISGMLLIARRRVVALVVGSLVVGATVAGYVAPLFT
jgi:uncharacterized membrane protein YraQ (UPF0718 family)